MSAGLALQVAIRARLISTAAVTDRVPAANILDRNERPAPDPSIILGEQQEIDEGGSIARRLTTVVATLHVWKREAGLTGVKVIAWAIRSAILSARLDLGPGFSCVDARVDGARFLRDPDGETAHAVVTVTAIVEEVA